MMYSTSIHKSRIKSINKGKPSSAVPTKIPTEKKRMKSARTTRWLSTNKSMASKILPQNPEALSTRSSPAIVLIALYMDVQYLT